MKYNETNILGKEKLKRQCTFETSIYYNIMHAVNTLSNMIIYLTILRYLYFTINNYNIDIITNIPIT